MTDELDWNVAIYCFNEEKRLKGCLDSVIAALTGRRALITVVLNGSQDRSLDIAREAALAGGPIEIFQIAAADKSNAINQFIYTLRSPASAYGAVDGYAYIAATSFRAMEERLEADSHAMAVTGVCTNGRTMKLAAERTLKIGGQLHGQLHAFR
ncbi:MAG TPA: glycosyltransferase, partial [Stellaceae bacterium]|nr:glycosyltransferase [Stellaceae bacterium]